MKRSQEEVKAAIERLKLNKTRCKSYSYFGDDNYAKIDVMIDTIENSRSEDYVYSHYPSVNEDDEEDSELHGLWQSGINGLEWLRGESKLEDLLFPEPAVS